MTYFYFYQEFSYLYFLFSQELQELEIYKYPYLNLHLQRKFLFIEVSQVLCPTRPEGAEALSPGQRPRLFWAQTCRPVRAKALKLQAIHKAFALTGRQVDCHYTQGDALG
nr:hypothetical protein [Prevotella sp.]